MVMSSTRGVPGQRPSSSLRMRAVVDFPTATEPATPMMNGVLAGRSPRKSVVMRCRPAVAPT